MPWVDIGVRPGYNQRYQGFFDKDRRIAARIGSLYAEPYYHSPRHRHTFQQVRYVLSGKMKYGSEVYEKGDCLYIPEGAYYGPVKPVESGEQLYFADIQFEGPSGIPYPEPEEVVDAQRRLAETGTFAEGVYTFPSPRRWWTHSGGWPRPGRSRKASTLSPAAASATLTRRSWRN